jgi:hypothetical protein
LGFGIGKGKEFLVLRAWCFVKKKSCGATANLALSSLSFSGLRLEEEMIRKRRGERGSLPAEGGAKGDQG